MPLVSVTRLRLRSWRYLPEFFWRSWRTVSQARSAPGYLGHALLRDEKLAFWTCTLWRDEASMRAFVTWGAHRSAMPRLMDWCDEASVAHWEQEFAALPSWTDAHRRLQAEGRRSKVKHPSPAQERFEVPPPRLPAVR
jgi:heme-degrading monooxygenase HmoA